MQLCPMAGTYAPVQGFPEAELQSPLSSLTPPSLLPLDMLDLSGIPASAAAQGGRRARGKIPGGVTMIKSRAPLPSSLLTSVYALRTHPLFGREKPLHACKVKSRAGGAF